MSLKIFDLGAYSLMAPTQPAIPGGYLGGGDLDGRITSAMYEVTTTGTKILQYSGMAECGTRVCNVSGRITFMSAGPGSTYVRTFSESSWDDTYGAVAADGTGRAFEVYSRSNASTTPQAAIVTSGFRTIVARSVSGTMSCSAGATPPCNERWGDYLGAAQDPSNHEELWFVALYQTASGDDGWTTIISSLSVT